MMRRIHVPPLAHIPPSLAYVVSHAKDRLFCQNDIPLALQIVGVTGTVSLAGSSTVDV